MGLVSKDNGRDTHLIFHLSYPKVGTTSVNSNTPAEDCQVQYTDFDQVVQMCLQLLDKDPQPTIYLSKLDVDSTFRNLGLSPQSWPWTILKATSPIDGQVYYFVDKCLPFGSSKSCALFQLISDGIAHIVRSRMQHPLINYLDDYLFAALLRSVCNWQMEQFLHMCKEINMPVSNKKTHWETDCTVFLGFLVDSKNGFVLIPLEKINKANDLLTEFLQLGKKKETVHHLQQLCGFLNLLCRCVVPGRAFTRWLYAPMKHNMKPHHHIKLTGELKMDLRVWQHFITHPTIFCHPFTDFRVESTIKLLDLYTDASENFKLSCRGCFKNKWFFIRWDEAFMCEHEPSIEYLELYAVTVAVVLWVANFSNSRVALYCDNQAVVVMINDSSSSCRNCMLLIRIIVLQGLIHNVVIKARFARTRMNTKADAISRRKFQLFKSLTNFQAEEFPLAIPQNLWPMDKLWLK